MNWSLGGLIICFGGGGGGGGGKLGSCSLEEKLP